MPRRYPPLKLREVIEILHALGFRQERSVGSHHRYTVTRKGSSFEVTVDHSIAEFDTFLIKSMIKQAGCTRTTFYGATKATAKKIGVPFKP
jgi:predicted RNA binding protein YcfA (HicA-like mRNA interferase family)